MSGGHFDYKQGYIRDIAEQLEETIRLNGKKKWFKIEDWEDTHFPEYPEEIINEFKNAVIALKLAYIYAQRIDWFLSGDDGEDSFMERLGEELEELMQQYDI